MYENIDRRILNVLLNDGRASLRSVAEDTDVSVTTISNHLNELEADDVITGYAPQINYGAFGYDVLAVHQVDVSGANPKRVAEEIADIAQTLSVFEVTGDSDITIMGRYRDTDDMNNIVKEISSIDDVHNINTSVVLNEVKNNEQFELPVDEE